LYTILRNRARKKLAQNSVKPETDDYDSVNAANKNQRKDSNSEEQVISSAGRPTLRNKDVECKKTKDKSRREPRKRASDESLSIPDSSQRG
jgi:hypothetical protein